MGPAFDPYYTWLGIAPAEQPPSHYRLLGLTTLETNPTVIEHAADRVMIHLRTFATGPNGALSQRLLNEVAAARMCLLDPAAKARYDAQLPGRSDSAIGSAGQRLPPMPKSATSLPKAQALPAMPVAVPVDDAPLPVVVSMPKGASSPVAGAARKVAPARRPDEVNNPQAAAIINVVKIVLGGLGGMSLVVIVFWVFFRRDPLGLFEPAAPPVVQKQPVKTDDGNRPIDRPTTPIEPRDSGATGKKPSTTNPNTSDPAISRPATSNSANTTDPSLPETSPPITPIAPESVNPATPSTTPTVKTKPKGKVKVKSSTQPSTNPPNITPPVVIEPAPPVTPPVAPAASRRPQPTNEEQATKLAELKDVYKSEFDGADRPSGRDKFPTFLLATADKLTSDPVARFVLLKEAFNRVIAAKDFSLAVEVVDRLEQEFEVDPFALRVHTLIKASENARQPADKQAIMLCSLDLAELAVNRQRMSEALKLARIADNFARGLQNTQLRAKAVNLKADVEKAASEWGPVERARQALAVMPDDPAAALVDGRYRCLVAGDWAAGLPLLAKTGETPLAAAAKIDLAGPSETVSPAALGDAWFDLAKSDEKLAPCYARALHWYRQAVAAATGLDQVRIQQRVEQIEAMQLPERLLASRSTEISESLPQFAGMYFRGAAFEPVNCFNFVNQLELKASPWNAYSSTSPSIYSKPDIVFGRVPAHVPNIPREYQVGIKVHTYYGSDGRGGPFVVGLVGPRGQFAAVIDLPLSSTEYCSYLTLADAKTPQDNPTLQKYPSKKLTFSDDPVVCQVRRSGVTVMVDRRVVCEYDGDLTKLVLPREWAVNDTKALLVGAHQASYRVSSWVLEPLSAAPRAIQSDPLPGFSIPEPARPGLPPGIPFQKKR